jgi:imidazolonepropionase-like amidohydrolase
MLQRFAILVFASIVCLGQSHSLAQVAVRGKVIYTMGGEPIKDGTILIRDGKIASVGKSSDVAVPDGFEVLEAAVVTPGLIDAHSTVGLSGMLNQDEDQDQLEHSQPIQPALRAFDGFNSRDELIPWVRGFGVTTVNTGHAPGELVSGQTMVVKTIEGGGKDAILVETRAVATTLSTAAKKSGKESPGTRGKMLQMLRSKLLAAREYQQKQTKAETKVDDSKDGDNPEPPSRDLELETLAEVLAGKIPLLITAHRAQDITNALRLAKEFKFKLWLDGASESYLLIDEIKQANVPVLIHPSMARAVGDLENLSFETASKLVDAGIPLAMQSGYEAYVPKTRVVLFEAAIAAANGLTFEQTLASITINSAKILGVDDRVGSIKPGKDGDLALYDGDPFEYTTHCVGTIIDGKVASRGER